MQVVTYKVHIVFLLINVYNYYNRTATLLCYVLISYFRLLNVQVYNINKLKLRAKQINSQQNTVNY